MLIKSVYWMATNVYGPAINDDENARANVAIMGQ